MDKSNGNLKCSEVLLDFDKYVPTLRRTYRLNDRQIAALKVLVLDGSKTAAAEAGQYNRRTIHRWFVPREDGAKTMFRRAYDMLREDVIGGFIESMPLYGRKAIQRLIDAVDGKFPFQIEDPVVANTIILNASDKLARLLQTKMLEAAVRSIESARNAPEAPMEEEKEQPPAPAQVETQYIS
jgi:hypothetical protein